MLQKKSTANIDDAFKTEKQKLKQTNLKVIRSDGEVLENVQNKIIFRF